MDKFAQMGGNLTDRITAELSSNRNDPIANLLNRLNSKQSNEGNMLSENELKELLKDRTSRRKPRNNRFVVDITTGEPIGNVIEGGDLEGSQLVGRGSRGRSREIDPYEYFLDKPPSVDPVDFLSERLGLRTPVRVEMLDDPQFTKGGRKVFKGGGYVKGYAPGGNISQDWMEEFFKPTTVYENQPFDAYAPGVPNSIYENARDVVPLREQELPWFERGLEKSNWRPNGDIRTMPFQDVPVKDGSLGYPNMQMDYGDAQQEDPFASLFSTPSFVDGVESGDTGSTINGPVKFALDERDQAINDKIRQLMISRLENYEKNQEEKDNDPLKSIFGDYNKGLFQMGMGILANSGYPNSAGEAIGKGVLGVQNAEEQKSLAKQQRENDRLKELLNMRYMQATMQAMDPQVKMQLARYAAAQEQGQKAISHRYDMERDAFLEEGRNKRAAERNALTEKLAQPIGFGAEPIIDTE